MHGLRKFLLFHIVTCLGRNGHGSEIINGEEVPENSMLYMVSLQDSRTHVCGGFLVSDEFVLTAANCRNREPVHVYVGCHNLNDALRSYYIEEEHTPNNYREGEMGDDIMLLKLSRKVQLGNSVQTIQLPESETNIKENAQCLVAGWGKISTHGQVVDKLRMVNVSVINPQVCKERWPSLPPNVICAGGYGTNKGICQISCLDDSGGPLVCDGIAVGVASFNKNCVYPDVPNVYTDISKYTGWIRSIIKPTKRWE